MDFVIDPELPQEKLDEIGSYLGDILAAELKRRPEEVKVEVMMTEDEDDSETINIIYVIKVNGKAPDDFDMYRAQELFERIMHVSEDEPYSVN